MSEVNLDDEIIYKSIKMPDLSEPIPIHRQIAGHSINSEIRNSLSLAEAILAENVENSSVQRWAKFMINTFSKN